MEEADLIDPAQSIIIGERFHDRRKLKLISS